MRIFTNIPSITKFFRTFLTLLVLMLSTEAWSQNYPVTCTPIVKPSYSLKWSEISTNNEMFKVHLLLKDLTKPAVDVYLKIRLSGVGVDIRTVDGFIPSQTIKLIPGESRMLTASDLAEYLNISNIVVDGVDISTLYNGGRLPEGLYTWTVEAYEVDRNRQVSNTGMALMNVFKNYPPIINIPQDGAVLPLTTPQNVLFSWTSRSTASLNAAQGKTYKLRIYPLTDGDDDPNMVANSGIQPIEITTTTPYFSYGAGNIPLEKGKRYAVQVQEEDANGADEYENEGKSQVVTFSYGKPCVAPEGMVINPIGKGRVELTCEASAEDAETYPITAWYKTPDAKIWNSVPFNGNSAVISGLKDKTDYEFKLSSACGDNTNTMAALRAGDIVPSGDPSTEPETFTIDDSEFDEEEPEILEPTILDPYTIGIEINADGTPRPVETVNEVLTKIIKPVCVNNFDAYESCSPNHPAAQIPTGTIPLASLAVGDVLGIYDYAVLVTEVSGGTALAGKGLVKLPFLDNAFMAVEFKGIKAWKTDDPNAKGGCVYDVPENGFRTRPINQRDLENEKVDAVSKIIKLTDPTVFHGNLDKAIKEYVSLTPPPTTTPTTQQRQDLGVIAKGISVATSNWKDKFTEAFSAGGVPHDSNPKIKEIIDEMDGIINQLNTDIPNIKNGPSYPSIPNLKEKIDAIIEKIKVLQQENTPKPPRIQNVLATNIGYNDATLTWQGDPRFTKYVISYKTADGGELLETVTGNRLQLKNLREKSQYGFKIEGYVGDDVVDKYGVGLFDTQKSSNPTPTNVRYSLQSDGTVLLEWDYPKEYGYTIEVRIKDKNGNEKLYFTNPQSPKVNIGKLISGDIYSYSIYVPKYNTSATGVIDIKCSQFNLTSSAKIIELGQSVTLTASGCPNDDVEWSDTPFINLRGRIYTTKPSGERTYTAYCKPLDCSKSITIGVTSTDCSDISFKINDPIYYDSFWAANFTVAGCEGGNVYWSACEKCTPTYTYQNNTFAINGLGTTPITFYAKCVKTINGVTKTCFDSYPLKSTKDCIFEKLEITSSFKKIIKGTSLSLTIVGCSNGTIKWEHNGQNIRQLVVSPTEKTNYAVTCTPNDSKCNTVRAAITIDVIELDCNKFIISPFNEIFENIDPVILKASECLGTLTWSNGSNATSISVIPTTEAQKYSVTCKIDETRQCSASSTVTFVPPNCNNFKVSSKQDSYNNVVLSAIGCSGEVTWNKGLGKGATINIKLDVTTTYTATCSSTKCSNPVTVFIAPKAVQCPTFSVSPVSETADKYSNVTITANNCTGKLKWDTGEISNSITVRVESEKTYKVTCEADGFTNIQCAVVKPSFTLNTQCTNNFKLSASDYNYTESDTKPITLSTSGNCSGTVSFSSGSNLVRPQLNSTYYAICDDGNKYCTSNTVAINVLTCNNIYNRNGNFDSEIRDNFDKTKKIVTVSNCIGLITWGGRSQSSNTFEVNIPAELTTYTLGCTRPLCTKSITLEGFCEDFTANIVTPSSVSAIGSSEKKTTFYNSLNQPRTIFTVGCPTENLSWKDMDGNTIYENSVLRNYDIIRVFCRINNSDCVRTINLKSSPSSTNVRTTTQQTTTTPIIDNTKTYAAIIADESAAAECTTCNSCNIALNKGMSIFLKPLISDIISQTAVGKDVNGNYTTASVKQFLEHLITTLKNNAKLSSVTFPTDLTVIAQSFVSDQNIERLVNQLTVSITGNICTTEFNSNILSTYSSVANTLLPLIKPPTLVLNATPTNASCSQNNGSVNVSATGGVPPYEYSKDGINYQTSQWFRDLGAGTYTLNVRDYLKVIATTTAIIENDDNDTEVVGNFIIVEANARIGASSRVVVQYDANYLPTTIMLKGMTARVEGNLLNITAVEKKKKKKWLDKYYMLFSKNNPNQFTGFYKQEYYENPEQKPCTILSTRKINCKPSCVEGHLPRDFYRTGHKFFEDLLGNGKFINHYASNAEGDKLIDDIDILVEEMMSDGTYQSFLQADLTKYIQSGKSISNDNLKAIKQLLLDFRQAQTSALGSSNQGNFEILLKLLKECILYQNPTSNCVVGTKTVVPRCLWDQDNPISNVIAFAAGAMDGTVELVDGAFSVMKYLKGILTNAYCLVEPTEYLTPSADCLARRKAMLDDFKLIGEIAQYGGGFEALKTMGEQLKGYVSAGLDTWWNHNVCEGLNAESACCYYTKGKWAFDIALWAFGAGEINTLDKMTTTIGKIGTRMSEFTTKAADLFNTNKFITIGKILKNTANNAIDKALLKVFNKIRPEFALVRKADGSGVFTYTGVASKEPVAQSILDGFKTSTPEIEKLGEGFGGLKVGDLVEDAKGAEIMKQIQDASGNKYIGFGRNENRNGKRVFVLTALLSKTTSDVLNMTVPQTETIIEEEIDPNCTLCNKDYWICLIDKKATYSLKATALNKICLEIPKATSDALCQELYGYEVAEINAFLEDLLSNLSNADALSNHVSSIDVELLRAWKIVYEGRCAGVTNCNENVRKDWQVLYQVKNMYQDQAILTALGDRNGLVDIIKKNERTPCNTCGSGGATYLNKMDVYLKDVEYFVENYQGISGWNTVIGSQGIKNGGVNQVEATAFMLRVLHENPVEFESQVSGFEVSTGVGKRKMDIQKHSGTNVECKSWDDNADTFADFVAGTSNSYQQFLAYLQVAPDLSKLEYWLDGRKLSGADKLQTAKLKFQTLFQNKTQDVFDKIWANTSMMGSLIPQRPLESIAQWQIRARSEFVTMVNSLNKDLFKFIKVK